MLHERSEKMQRTYDANNTEKVANTHASWPILLDCQKKSQTIGKPNIFKSLLSRLQKHIHAVVVDHKLKLNSDTGTFAKANLERAIEPMHR